MTDQLIPTTQPKPPHPPEILRAVSAILTYTEDRAFWDMPMRREIIAETVMKETGVVALHESVTSLQQRLVERTEQSTATAYRDAETIRDLKERLRKYEPETPY